MSIKSWFRNWLLNEDNDRPDQDIRVEEDDHYDHHRNTIKFTVSTARGGCIVSVRQYDSVRDENNYSVHVLHDDDDVATNIAHIVSMELLRKN
jgi:hypothetical protein